MSPVEIVMCVLAAYMGAGCAVWTVVEGPRFWQARPGTRTIHAALLIAIIAMWPLRLLVRPDKCDLL